MNLKRSRWLLSYAVLLLSLFLFQAPATATFHFWAINEIYSNAAGTIQFIELKEIAGAPGQHLLAGHDFTTNANIFEYTTNLPNSSTGNKFFLMGTSNLGSQPGGITPDYIIPANFFSVNGDTLNFAENTSVVTFGSGVLPTNGTNSINASGVSQVNSPTNFSGAMGSIEPALPSTVYVDFDYSGTEAGTVNQPYNTLSEGIDAVAAGGAVRITGNTNTTGSFTKSSRLIANTATVRIGLSTAFASQGAASPVLDFIEAWATPSAREDAAPTDALTVRLQAETNIDTNTLWVAVETQGSEWTAVWEPVHAGSTREILVVVSPETSWLPGSSVSVSAGASTVNGDSIESPTAKFDVARDPAIE